MPHDPVKEEKERGFCARFPSVDRNHDFIREHAPLTSTLIIRVLNNASTPSRKEIDAMVQSVLVRRIGLANHEHAFFRTPYRRG